MIRKGQFKIDGAETISFADQFSELAGVTYGWILVLQGDAKRGLVLLQKAVSLAPDVPRHALPPGRRLSQGRRHGGCPA